MDKEAYYFPHFTTARNDRKIKRVRKELGIEGYGIFFMLLEVLREQTDISYPLDDIDLLADEMGTSEQKVRTVITNYQLFEIDEDNKFFSPKLLIYLEPYFKMKEQRRLAGIASGKSRKQLQMNDRSNPLNENEQKKVKEMKEESKENEIKAKEIIDYLNTKSDRSFSYCESNIKHITARLNDGHTKEQCLKVIDVKCSEWLNTDFDKYLRPETLFKPGKFENYLNQKQIIKQTELSNEEIAEKLWGKKNEQ